MNHYVHESRQGADFSAVTEVGVDETSSKRGHNYVSLFVDMKSSKVLFVTEGKDASALERFKTDVEAHHGDPSNIPEVCCDMSPAFISGVEKHFPEAHMIFDKFHVLKILNEAVDEVRRQEQQSRPDRFPAVFDFLADQGADVEIGEAILMNRRLEGLPLNRIRLPGNALVMGIRRNGEVIIPHGDTIFYKKDTVMLLGNFEHINQAKAILEISSNQPS